MARETDNAVEINRKYPDGLKESGKPYKVLVVDDSSVLRSKVTDILKSKQYEICGEAGDGKEAVNLFRKLKPDLLMLGVSMPEKNGLDALKDILNDCSKAKIIVLARQNQKSSAAAAIVLGAKGFVFIPPIRYDVLDMVSWVLSDR